VGVRRRDSAGFQWIARLSEHAPQIPIVAILDACDERLAIAAGSVGAVECLCGDQVDLLPHALRYLIGGLRAEQAAAQSEENFQVLIEHASDITTLVNAQLMICYISPAAESTLGYAPAQLRGQEILTLLHPDDLPAAQAALTGALQNARQPITIEVRFRHQEEHWVYLEIIGRNVPSREGQPRLVLNARDITDRREVEEQLRRIQKLDSVGRLAAGIAHDFNNMLTVIQGHADRLSLMENQSPQAAESLRHILDASRRAANLTRQMLAFGRKQVLRPNRMDLNETVDSFTGMLRGMLSKHISLTCHYSKTPVMVRADLGMIEQVLMNLAVNARDAMANGGELRFETATVNLDAESLKRSPGANRGPHAVLTVSDTGCGIGPEILPRIFEPFFTTKDANRGSGLGLATVYGIVKQHGGWVDVDSRLGTGTAFKIFLPAYSEIFVPHRQQLSLLGGDRSQTLAGFQAGENANEDFNHNAKTC
jgi:two-component system, cell cycle sensor histidine kinase and response regulator CckA